MRWSDEIEYLQVSALGVGLMGWAIVRAAPEISEVDDFAGEAARDAGRAVLLLARGLARLVPELTDALGQYQSDNTGRGV
ncbi:hypothetical protein [Amycolatopsis sp. NPDC004378]